jgi:hypothetical protein
MISKIPNIYVPRYLILFSASQRNPILWPIQYFTQKSMLTCINDLAGAKVLIGELILCSAVKDKYITRKMKFRKFNI